MNIKSNFQISKEAYCSFCYLGFEVTQNRNGIIMHQYNYVNELLLVSVHKTKSKDEELNNEEFKELQSLVGQLSWANNQTRPEVAFDTCQIGVSVQDTKIEDLKT